MKHLNQRMLLVFATFVFVFVSVGAAFGVSAVASEPEVEPLDSETIHETDPEDRDPSQELPEGENIEDLEEEPQDPVPEEEEVPTIQKMNGPLFQKAMAISIIQDLEVNKTGGGDSKNFYIGETVTVKISFSAPDAKSEDHTTIQVPELLKLVSVPDFELTNTNGVTIAKASINTIDNTVTITFNDNVEGLTNISGSLEFMARTTSEGFTDDGYYQIVVTDSKGGSCQAEIWLYKSTADIRRDLQKVGTHQVDNIITWNVLVNFKEELRENVIITDTVEYGLEHQTGTLHVYKLIGLTTEGNTYRYTGRELMDSKVSITEDKTGFKIELGDITDAYQITVTTHITDYSVKNYYNVVEFDSDSVASADYRAHVFYSYGGSASGDMTGKLQVKKVDAESGGSLPGAEFDLYHPVDGFVTSLTIDSEGKSEVIEKLEVGTVYYLIETKAPSDYPDPDDTKYEATILGGNTLTELEVANEKIPQPEPKDPKGSVQVFKYDPENGNIGLEGAVFLLEEQDSKTEWSSVGLLTTDSTGFSEIISKLPNGTYRLIEEMAPEGYLLDQTPHVFEITDAESSAFKTVLIRISNEMEPTDPVDPVDPDDNNTGGGYGGGDPYERDKDVKPDGPEGPKEPEEPKTPDKDSPSKDPDESGSENEEEDDGKKNPQTGRGGSRFPSTVSVAGSTALVLQILLV